MGIRGELFSTRVTCEGRTYFFNVKENRMGDIFLTIVESKPTESENFDRRSIVIFRDDVRDFLKAFKGALGFMEKPGAAPPEIDFSPETATGKPRRRRTPAGFAGATSPKTEGEPMAKKRRIVVRKKGSAGRSSDSSAVPDDPA